MNHKENHPETGRPQPREAYGHPATTGDRYRFSDHKPGHDDSPATADETSTAREHFDNARIPPYDAGGAPKTSLANRVRAGLSDKEQGK